MIANYKSFNSCIRIQLQLAIACVFIIQGFLFSCTNAKTENTAMAKNIQKPAITEVEFLVVKRESFHEEFIYHGKVAPAVSAQLLFEQSGTITELPVRNGQFVKKGTILAKIDASEVALEMQKANKALEKAKIDLMDFLLSHKHSVKDTSKIDKQVMHTAKIKSGYYDALIYKKEVEHKLLKHTIKAPFDGQISRLQAKLHNPAGAYNYFCYISNTKKVEIEFELMENELDLINLNADVL